MIEHGSEKPFTCLIRFKDQENQINGWREIDKVLNLGGAVNVFKSPFPDGERLIYQVSLGQFEILKKFLEKNEVEYEIISWPKGANIPFIRPPGLDI